MTLERLRAELAPTPGRFNGMVRIVVAATIVLATSMTLEVPSLALSLFIVIYVIMLMPGAASQNSVAVAIAGTAAVLVLTLALALTLLIYKLTVDYAPLRLGAMALGFFLGMFAFRIFALPPVGFIIAIAILVTQAYVDLFAEPEAYVRGVLWVWMAIAYPAAVAVGVNLLLLPADPEPLLRREVAARLSAVARVLKAPRTNAEALAAFVAQGAAPLLTLLHLAEIRDASIKPLHAERAARLLLLQRLVERAALVADLAVEPSAGEQRCLAALAAECERFAAAVSSGVRALPAPGARGRHGASRSALARVLAELEEIVRDFAVAERPQADVPARGARLFVADALTNPHYAQFALKATMAAMLCYVAYTAVDWNGIHTCMITCVIVALGSEGATIQKATLRLIGCAIAGVLALASIVFVVPHMTSIAGLVLLVAAVTAPAAWIAMGSERTAYVGLQIAFTFYLAVLQGYAPSTDVTEFRDRFVGIVFGVVVMALVFTYVWPERAASGMAKSLAAALRRMAELARGSGDPGTPRAAAWQSLAAAQRFAALAAFEPDTPASSPALVNLSRRVLLVQAALARPAGIAVADALDAVANRLDSGVAVGRVNLPRGGESGLDELLIDRVGALQRAAGVV